MLKGSRANSAHQPTRERLILVQNWITNTHTPGQFSARFQKVSSGEKRCSERLDSRDRNKHQLLLPNSFLSQKLNGAKTLRNISPESCLGLRTLMPSLILSQGWIRG